MSITKTTTNVDTLKINYLTQEMYEDALENNEINANEIYLTPDNNTVSIDLNGSITDSPSFYAPTTAGTSGYYLKSNGSGEPTWATIPAGVTVTLNGSETTTPSFYAPTTAGTSGYYLKSNGSGAPSWTSFPTIPSITLNGSSTTSPSFYAPTSVGTSGYVLKSNGSGAPTWTSAELTDNKMQWTASTSSNTYYPLASTSTATTSTANTLNSISFYQYYNTAGGYRRLDLGNTTLYTSSGGAYGYIRLYGAAATYYGNLVPGTIGTTSGDGHLTANRTWTLPDKTGTIALTSDIPTVTDEKVALAAITASTIYYPIMGTGTSAATRQYDVQGFSYVGTDGTDSAAGKAEISLGNAYTSGSTNKYGRIRFYGEGSRSVVLKTSYNATSGNDCVINLPGVSGTIALTSDIPTVTDLNVKQLAAISTNGAYPIILGYSTATTEVTNVVNKTSTLTYNPSTQALTVGKSITVDSWTWDATTSGHYTLKYVS